MSRKSFDHSYLNCEIIKIKFHHSTYLKDTTRNQSFVRYNKKDFYIYSLKMGKMEPLRPFVRLSIRYTIILFQLSIKVIDMKFCTVFNSSGPMLLEQN